MASHRAPSHRVFGTPAFVLIRASVHQLGSKLEVLRLQGSYPRSKSPHFSLRVRRRVRRDPELSPTDVHLGLRDAQLQSERSVRHSAYERVPLPRYGRVFPMVPPERTDTPLHPPTSGDRVRDTTLLCDGGVRHGPETWDNVVWALERPDTVLCSRVGSRGSPRRDLVTASPEAHRRGRHTPPLRQHLVRSGPEERDPLVLTQERATHQPPIPSW